MTVMNMRTAINRALFFEMRKNPELIIMGEDVGRDGGVFQVTRGLFDEFGDRRVMDTPLAERMIIASAAGLALGGPDSLPPIPVIAEIQFEAFMLAGFDQLLNVIARMRNRTRGRLYCPLTIRAPWGGRLKAPEHHSDCHEALLAHIPGLRVLVLSSPARAYGLTLAAIRSNDPTVVLESSYNYSTEEEVEDDGNALPLDMPFLVRGGADLTIVSWGSMLYQCLSAADRLETEDGASADVFDLATIGATCDMLPIWDSVRETGRLMIVHEATKTGGFGAEVAARAAESSVLMKALRGRPIHRVCGLDVPIPYARLEDHFYPTTESILKEARIALEE